MATRSDPFRLSSPRIFLVRMVVFIILVGFIALILNRQITTAFMANPPLNSLIIGVMLIGIILGLRQVFRLFPEIRWANTFNNSRGARGAPSDPAGRRWRSSWPTRMARSARFPP